MMPCKDGKNKCKKCREYRKLPMVMKGRYKSHYCQECIDLAQKERNRKNSLRMRTEYNPMLGKKHTEHERKLIGERIKTRWMKNNIDRDICGTCIHATCDKHYTYQCNKTCKRIKRGNIKCKLFEKIDINLYKPSNVIRDYDKKVQNNELHVDVQNLEENDRVQDKEYEVLK